MKKSKELRMNLTEFFRKYGSLLPAYYKEFMKASYAALNVGGEMIMPDPTQKHMIIITK